MDTLRSIMDVFEVIFALILFFYVIFVVDFLYRKILKKGNKVWSELNPISQICGIWKSGHKKICVILSAIIIVGSFGLVADKFFSTTEIGSFFEKSSFEENYEAVFYIDEKPIFCIAEIWKEHYENGTSYRISYINLPYGKSKDVDEEYYPDIDENIIYLGDNSQRCKIVIGHVATERSYEMLENEVITAYGDFCGSKDGNKYHLTSCPSAKRIKDKNMIFFESEIEADIFRYEPCETCIWWY